MQLLRLGEVIVHLVLRHRVGGLNLVAVSVVSAQGRFEEVDPSGDHGPTSEEEQAPNANDRKQVQHSQKSCLVDRESAGQRKAWGLVPFILDEAQDPRQDGCLVVHDVIIVSIQD